MDATVTGTRAYHTLIEAYQYAHPIVALDKPKRISISQETSVGIVPDQASDTGRTMDETGTGTLAYRTLIETDESASPLPGKDVAGGD